MKYRNCGNCKYIKECFVVVDGQKWAMEPKDCCQKHEYERICKNCKYITDKHPTSGHFEDHCYCTPPTGLGAGLTRPNNPPPEDCNFFDPIQEDRKDNK
jgi:RNA polymerase subunit RPABC4/transcription elongation factor Spt4